MDNNIKFWFDNFGNIRSNEKIPQVTLCKSNTFTIEKPVDGKYKTISNGFHKNKKRFNKLNLNK